MSTNPTSPTPDTSIIDQLLSDLPEATGPEVDRIKSAIVDALGLPDLRQAKKVLFGDNEMTATDLIESELKDQINAMSSPTHIESYEMVPNAPVTADALIAMLADSFHELLTTDKTVITVSGLASIWEQTAKADPDELAKLRFITVQEVHCSPNQPIQLYAVQRLLFDQLQMCALSPVGSARSFIDGFEAQRYGDATADEVYLAIHVFWNVYVPDELVPPLKVAEDLASADVPPVQE